MLIRKSDNSYLIECSVIPKSREEKIVGIVADTLKVKLTAAPTDGKANKQLLKLLAKSFEIRVADITLVRGSTNRHKTVSVPIDAKLPGYLVERIDTQN